MSTDTTDRGGDVREPPLIAASSPLCGQGRAYAAAVPAGPSRVQKEVIGGRAAHSWKHGWCRSTRD